MINYNDIGISCCATRQDCDLWYCSVYWLGHFNAFYDAKFDEAPIAVVLRRVSVLKDDDNSPPDVGASNYSGQIC